MKISMKLVYQYMEIFINFSPTSNHLHALQVENCDSNSRLVVDEDDKVKSGLKGLNLQSLEIVSLCGDAVRTVIQVTENDLGFVKINPDAEKFLYKPWETKGLFSI